jgi:hypothetical protein
MAHHKSRLDTRTSTTPPEWLQTCSQIGEVVNSWAGRNDLVVYAGSDAGIGHTACFIKDTAEIELNTGIAFGGGVSPAIVGDFRERGTQYDWSAVTGVVYHEALHARYSEWNTDALRSMNPYVFETFQLLDEARIERKGVVAMPENQIFLRSSALELCLGDLDDEAVSKMSDVRISANVAGLALARVDAGVLKLTDVKSTYEKVLELMGEELFTKLRAIWCEFQQLGTGDVARGEQLAIKWNELLNEADPEGDPENQQEGCFPQGGGEAGEGEGEPKGKGKGWGELMDALGEDADETTTSVAKDLVDQQTKEENEQELKERGSKSKRQQQTKNEAGKVFSKATGAGESDSGSRLIEQRKPTGKERASAVTIAKMLEKAKYVERSVTEIKSVLPQGRLNTRVAIQNQALKSKGVFEQMPAWRANKRKHTDDPTLKIGVMVDISGSMGSAMEAMATTAWVLSEAGRRVQAKTAMVYYGSDVFATLKVGQHLDQVSVWSAPDGTEKFGRAFDALDGTLDLVYGQGVRMLVIVSDGHYTGEETQKAKNAIKMCADNGVAVLWVTPKECYSGMGERLVGKNGVVLDGMDTNQIALAIGRSATDALNKVSGGM